MSVKQTLLCHIVLGFISTDFSFHIATGGGSIKQTECLGILRPSRVSDYLVSDKPKKNRCTKKHSKEPFLSSYRDF